MPTFRATFITSMKCWYGVSCWAFTLISASGSASARSRRRASSSSALSGSLCSAAPPSPGARRKKKSPSCVTKTVVPSVRMTSSCSVAVGRGQGERVLPLLERRRHEQKDQEQEDDIDQGGDVDHRLDAPRASRATEIHAASSASGSDGTPAPSGISSRKMSACSSISADRMSIRLSR